MINPMKQQYEAKDFKNEFELLPKGEYEAKIVSIGDWKSKVTPSLKVWEYDDKGRKVKDEKGADKFTMESNVTTYSAQVVFEVIDGTFDGVKVYHYLNAHPNQPWAIPSFLNACQVTGQVSIPEIASICVNAFVMIYVDIENKPYPGKPDPITGVVKEETRERNVVKRIKASDLGI
jgi:hypothetical protein